MPLFLLPNKLERVMKPEEEKKPQKMVPIKSADGDSHTFFEAHKKVYPRSIRGYFMRWRWAMVFLTQFVFYVIPWIQWGDRQMVLFDIGARRFYLFGMVLYPQDVIYLAALLIICALALFLFTAVAGRLWCGFSCPQTVYTEIFMWIEQKVEGDRSARIRLDNSGWTFEKIWRKSLKQFLWIVVSLWTGFTFVGFFVPIRELGAELLALQGSWQIFWALFYGFATYGNAGYLREQVCKYMCPYARFQSAMLDRDSLIVSYDPARGEMRGPRRKGTDYKAQGLGDCIDCKLCVQVCPVGIDIRNGFQYECIGCGLCIDACDSIMDNMQYPRGLIRFTTQNGVAQGWAKSKILRKIFRPRVLIYSAILIGLSIATVVSMGLRQPLKVDIIRDRASLARIVAGGKLENIYRLQVMNATETAQNYRIRVHGLEGIELVEGQSVTVPATDTVGVSARVQIPYGSAGSGSHPIIFDVDAESGQGSVSEHSVFLVPR